MALNASHAVLKLCLASSRLVALPNDEVLCEQHFSWMVYVSGTSAYWVG